MVDAAGGLLNNTGHEHLISDGRALPSRQGNIYTTYIFSTPRRQRAPMPASFPAAPAHNSRAYDAHFAGFHARAAASQDAADTRRATPPLRISRQMVFHISLMNFLRRRYCAGAPFARLAARRLADVDAAWLRLHQHEVPPSKCWAYQPRENRLFQRAAAARFHRHTRYRHRARRAPTRACFRCLRLCSRPAGAGLLSDAGLRHYAA